LDTFIGSVSLFIFGETLQEIVRVKRKFNITIPKKLRKDLTVKVGQLIEMKLEGDRIILKPIAEDPSSRLEELIGNISSESISKEAEAIVKEAKSSLARNLERRRE